MIHATTSGRSPLPRRFTLLDALILVAALAGAMALYEIIRRDERESLPFERAAGTVVETVFVLISHIRGVLSICQYAHAGPSGGLPAQASAAMAHAHSPAGSGGVLSRRGDDAGQRDRGCHVDALPQGGHRRRVGPFQPVYESRISLAVIAAWAALALGGRWQAEPSAVDRAGRLLGLFWVIFAVWPWINSYALTRLSVSFWPW